MKINEIVIATSNQNKLKEFNEIFSPYNIKVISLKDLNINIDIEETGTTFKDNALLKAKEIAKYTSKIILSDDSGIIINDMGDNKPGVYSHRFQNQFGGVKNTNEYVTKNYSNSKAHYTCSICIYNLTDKPLSFEGYMYGHIAKESKGNNGFGYDPIFIPEGYNNTLGELGDEIKNSISHRGNAIKLLLQYFKDNNLI